MMDQVIPWAEWVGLIEPVYYNKYARVPVRSCAPPDPRLRTPIGLLSRDRGVRGDDGYAVEAAVAVRAGGQDDEVPTGASSSGEHPNSEHRQRPERGHHSAGAGPVSLTAQWAQGVGLGAGTPRVCQLIGVTRCCWWVSGGRRGVGRR